MKTSAGQAQEQSHLHFQMWDQYLHVLNSVWDLEQPTQPMGQSEPQAELPGSFLKKIGLLVKKFMLYFMRPIGDRLMHSQLVAQITRLDQQREFNARVVQTFNGLVELTDSEFKCIRDEVSQHLHQFQSHLDGFQSHLDTSQTHLNGVQSHLQTLQSHLDTVQSHLNTMQNHIVNRLEQIEPRFAETELILWAYDRRKEALEFEQISMNQKLEQILLAIDSLKRGEVPDVENLPSPERQKDYSYFVFENRHRGDEKTIKRRLADYVSYFKGCSNVLDIGCARGEFLELLAEHQIQGYGIDLNHSFVQYCQQKGLHVQETDALSHLRDLADISLGGIFIAHLIEHFPIADLQKLLHLCFEKLAPHHYLVLETPNPCSVYALSQYFYKDLSHDKPLHPEAILFLVKSVGFQQAEIVYKNPFPTREALQLLKPPETADTMLHTMIDVSNRNFQQLNTLLYGHLDYAIIARKRPVV